MRRHYILAAMATLTAVFVFSAIAQERSNSTASTSATAPDSPSAQSAAPAATHSSESATAASDAAAIERSLRLEGEKRFRTNCGRCHMPPHKFPPRVMATAIRHMRVRATITDEDMRLILRYMTQ
jgi:mono/diheme cytochrome c family protein